MYLAHDLANRISVFPRLLTYYFSVAKVWCYYVVVGNGGAPGYYDSASESSGPPLEAVVTIPIHHGTGAGARSRHKVSGYS